MKLRLAAAGAALLTALALLGGCADSPAPEPTPAGAGTTPSQAAPTDAGEPLPTAGPTEPAPTVAVPDAANYNRLTGEYDNPAGAKSRAVGVMIGNNGKSRPQIGIWSGDLFLEAETEGGITRIMAVFADPSRIPEKLCPVRSARSPFALMAQSLDLVYVHAGGSVEGLKTVQNTGLDSVNALSDNLSFWRDAGLKASRGTEYSLCTSGEKIADRIRRQGWRTVSDRAPFTFGGTASGAPCSRVQVTFSGSQTDSFLYDPETDLYTKYLGRLANPTLHTDAAGGSLQVANLLILYDQRYAENDTTINFKLYSGDGVLVSGGKSRPIRWNRNAYGLTFSEESGTAAFLPGKTYICLVSQANKSATVLE